MDKFHMFLVEQHRTFLASLYAENYLDYEHVRPQNLADQSDLYNSFYQSCDKDLANLTIVIEKSDVPWKLVRACGSVLKKASVEVGANRINKEFTRFQGFVDQKDIKGCLYWLYVLGMEYQAFKERMEHLFRLEEEIRRNGGDIPQIGGLAFKITAEP